MDEPDKPYDDEREYIYEEDSDEFVDDFPEEDWPKASSSLPDDDDLISQLDEDEEGEVAEEDQQSSAFFTEETRLQRRGSKKQPKSGLLKNLILIIAVLALIGASAYLVVTRVDFSALVTQLTSQPEEAPEKKPVKAKVKDETKSAQVKTAPKETVEKETTPQTTAIPPKTRVLNGNGLIGEADRIAEVLRKNGAEILETGNADKHSYEKTLIAAKPAFLEKAQELATKLGNEYSAIVEASLPETDKADIQIILGAPTLNVGQFKLAVLNGNNIKGEAAVIANALKSKGWQIVRQENADKATYSRTIIKFKADLAAAAKKIQSEISTRYPSELHPDLPADSPEDIQIILGKDKKS